jgi:hypothetical protein
MQSPSYQLYVKLKRLELSLRVFIGNYHQLVTFLKALRKPEVLMEIMPEDHADKFDVAMGEVMRGLHNYVASAITLKKHVENFARDVYQEEDLAKTFDSQLHELWSGSPVFDVVHGLRNYMLKQDIPLYKTTIQWSSDGKTDVVVALNVDRFSSWQGFNRRGREFIKTLPPPGRLEDIVEPHTAAVLRFFEWLFRWHNEEVYPEVRAELRRLEQQYAELLARIEVDA